MNNPTQFWRSFLCLTLSVSVTERFLPYKTIFFFQVAPLPSSDNTDNMQLHLEQYIVTSEYNTHTTKRWQGKHLFHPNLNRNGGVMLKCISLRHLFKFLQPHKNR